jgi:hypothetical protein
MANFLIKLTFRVDNFLHLQLISHVQRVDNSRANGLRTSSPKKSLSKHTNMGASFVDLVETDLLVKTDFKSKLSFKR